MEPHLRCLIVDDEKPAHAVIASHISKTEGLTLVSNAYNGHEALKILKAETVDILFLDIQMPLVNGLELLASLPMKPATIITTAFQEFAFDAWQHDAIDYLQKPVSYIKFMKAIDKVKVYCLQQRKTRPFKEALSFKVNGEEIALQAAQIIYFSGLGNYLKVFSHAKKSPLIVYDTLANLYNQLGQTNFVQIHRSYVVNKAFIKEIEKEIVHLTTGERLPVGRKYQILLEKPH
jgi:DNA-binding LytR/AlgR family response regulator